VPEEALDAITAVSARACVLRAPRRVIRPHPARPRTEIPRSSSSDDAGTAKQLRDQKPWPVELREMVIAGTTIAAIRELEIAEVGRVLERHPGRDGACARARGRRALGSVWQQR
jgi:hypothetical protein